MARVERNRIVLTCPLCGRDEDVPFAAVTKLTHTSGNGRKGFLTADVSAGGIEHTCKRED